MIVLSRVSLSGLRPLSRLHSSSLSAETKSTSECYLGIFHASCHQPLIMRRKTRKAIIQFTLFLSVLFLIIYLGGSSPSITTYQWSKITYKTTSRSLPEARGVCPGLKDSTKPALVVARVQADDLTWLTALESVYHLCVYTADALVDKESKNLQVPANRGHESMAYLTFIIDNYDNIPKAGAVFVHGSRKAWHNDAKDWDNAPLLSALAPNIPNALEHYGYHNLRCDWSVSTCDLEAKAQGSMEVRMQARLVPWDTRAVSDAALPAGLASLFGESGKLGRTDTLRSQCCAQFVVARQNIMQHSREEYVAIRQWLLDGTGAPETRNKDAAPVDDKVAGRILSYIWHILFIEQDVSRGGGDGLELGRLNSMACPSAEDCYCRLYGRCNLKSCTTPGRCHGQYLIPPNLKVPADT